MRDPEAESIENLERAGVLCEPTVRAAIQSLKLPPGSRGIDIGCGIGLSAKVLAEETQPGGTVVGVDISGRTLERARQRMRDHPLAGNVTFQPGDMNALPFDRAAFDWACSVDCVGYPAGNFPSLLREIARVVRPGGRVALLAWSSQQILPGHTMLEARLNAACSAYAPFLQSQPPESHFLRALRWFAESGLSHPGFSTFAGAVQAPLAREMRTAVASLFEMLWAGSLSNASGRDADQFRRLCSPDSPDFIPDDPGYCGFFTYSMFAGVVEERVR